MYIDEIDVRTAVSKRNRLVTRPNLYPVFCTVSNLIREEHFSVALLHSLYGVC